MGDKKSNSDNEKRQNKKSIHDDVNNQDEKNIIENVNEQDKNLNGDTPSEQPLSGNNDTSSNCDIKSLADKAVNINLLRYELDRLQLDFKARAYFENDVRPLIDTLYTISYASNNYSTTANNFANTSFGHSSKIKDALDLAEEINEISEDLIEVLRCKIDKMLKLSKYDCK
jgi:hypothetical protein